MSAAQACPSSSHAEPPLLRALPHVVLRFRRTSGTKAVGPEALGPKSPGREADPSTGEQRPRCVQPVRHLIRKRFAGALSRTYPRSFGLPTSFKRSPIYRIASIA